MKKLTYLSVVLLIISGCSTGGNGELRQHFLDMGVIPGTLITKIKLAPMGDPIEFDVNGYELTMRLADAEKIEVDNSLNLSR